jgi:hypothetical protein
VNPELWQTRPLLAVASLAPVLAGLVWMVMARELPLFARHPARLGWATWLLTRAGFAWVVWGLLGHSGIDQLVFFLPQARHALAGELPYRDFASAYGPLFAPLLGQCVRVLGESGPFVLFLAADLVAWRALARAEGEDSAAAWGYVATPLTWYFTVRYGQDEALAAAFLALAWWALRRERGVLAGVALGVGLCVTKPLFALPALALWLGAGRHRVPALLAVLVPAVLVHGLFLAWGAPVLQPLALEGANFGVGPTLWRVPVVLTGWDAGPAGWLPFAGIAAAGMVLLARRGADGTDHAAWQHGAFAALAPKFMPMYAAMWAPLLAVWAGRDADRRGWWLVYGALLPLAWALDSGPLQGLFGRVWQGIAVAGLLGIALLALWPLKPLARR